MAAYMLVQALDEDQEGDIVEYGKIFEEDREFNQGEFAECLRDQWLQVRCHGHRGVRCSAQSSTGMVACLGKGRHLQCSKRGS